jgi:hypothetical protein
MLTSEIESELKTDDDQIGRLTDLLTNRFGYKYVNFGYIQRFTKGNLLSNIIMFNPADWKSEITVKQIDQKILVELRISTFGQLVTNKEKEFWETFHTGLLKTLNNESFEFKDLISIAKKASRANVIILLAIIVIMLILLSK